MEKEKAFFAICVFTFSIKPQNWSFDIYCFLENNNDMYQNVQCTCRAVVLFIESIIFIKFFLLLPSWLLEVLDGQSTVN